MTLSPADRELIRAVLTALGIPESEHDYHMRMDFGKRDLVRDQLAALRNYRRIYSSMERYDD